MVESHAATCARCQAVLAAMARTAPPLAARKWWLTSTVRWLVPIAIIPALAVVVRMNLPTGRQAAPAAPRPALSASPVSAPASESRPADVAAPPARAVDSLEQPPEAKRRERGDAEAGQRSALAKSNAAPSPPVQTAPASVVQQEQPTTPTFRARDASAAPAPAPVQPSAEVRAEAPRALAETVTVARDQAVVRSAVPLEIASPDRNVRWRIVAGNRVERSINAGTTWQAQSTGTSARLTAGAAPSPTVCWLVGPGGIVLVSQDGGTWERVAFPEPADLTAIRATDGSSATTTAADGRVFSTTDGGKTWR
jgi:hypothetical protein